MTDGRTRASHPIDRHVGARIRARRIALGLSQARLALRLGVSFQAVQKYEAGDSRIAASRLYDIARALLVPPAYFFDGCETPAPPPAASDPLEDRELAALLRGYRGIRNAALKADVRRLVASLGEAPPNPAD